MYRGEGSLLDQLDDHPFLNFNSSFFRDANISRSNRANVSETETEYRVELEAPGYQKSEINIEFGNDGRSLTITGRSEKSFEQGPDDQQESSKGHGVTVEEVPEESDKSAKSGKKQSSGKQESTAVAETNKNKDVGAPAAPKYWVSERTIGSFSRTFSFRAPLDTEKATASLEHGVLNVVIPKATKNTARKISIA
jgi:HSP20 family molecular chaperone IbpA